MNPNAMTSRWTRRLFGRGFVAWGAWVATLASLPAKAQMGGMGGMGGARGGGPPGGPPGGMPRCPMEESRPPPSITLVQVYVSERLRGLPNELELGPIAREQFERYATTVQNLLESEVQAALSVRALPSSALVALGNRIDEAATRLMAWEEVLETARAFLNVLTPAQRAQAEPRMVVSLDPRHWHTSGPPSGNPPGGTPSRTPPQRPTPQ